VVQRVARVIPNLQKRDNETVVPILIPDLLIVNISDITCWDIEGDGKRLGENT